MVARLFADISSGGGAGRRQLGVALQLNGHITVTSCDGGAPRSLNAAWENGRWHIDQVKVWDKTSDATRRYRVGTLGTCLAGAGVTWGYWNKGARFPSRPALMLRSVFSIREALWLRSLWGSWAAAAVTRVAGSTSWKMGFRQSTLHGRRRGCIMHHWPRVMTVTVPHERKSPFEMDHYKASNVALGHVHRPPLLLPSVLVWNLIPVGSI